MKIIHVLSDGKVMDDISNHVIKDVPDFYKKVNEINGRLNDEKKSKKIS